MYMLKTHKEHYDLFKLFHSSRSLLEFSRALGLESYFEGLSPEYFMHFEGTFYRKNKHLVDVIAERESLLVEKQPGFEKEKNKV